MNTSWKSIKTLEFDKIRELLSEVCPTEGSKKLALELEPALYEDEARARMKKTSDAKDMMTTRGMPSFGGVKDIEPILERADKNASLGCRDLLDTANVLRTARYVRDYPGDRETEPNSLTEIFERLIPNRRLEDRIYRTVISEDMIADDASPALSDIRRKIRQAKITCARSIYTAVPPAMDSSTLFLQRCSSTTAAMAISSGAPRGAASQVTPFRQ